MPLVSLSCPDCRDDQRAIESWRIDGGAMPLRTCKADHRTPCTKCKRPQPDRKSGMCDDCYQEQQNAANAVIR
jgi:hypothetical protein